MRYGVGPLFCGTHVLSPSYICRSDTTAVTVEYSTVTQRGRIYLQRLMVSETTLLPILVNNGSLEIVDPLSVAL